MTTLTTLADPALVDLLSSAGADVADGLQFIPADRLAVRPFDPGMTLVVLPAETPTEATLLACWRAYTRQSTPSSVSGRRLRSVS